MGQYVIDNFGEDFLNKIWSEKNKKSPFEYLPFSNKKVWWKCLNNIHEDFERLISISSVHNFRCPSCSMSRTESMIQEKVRTYIENMKYTILHESFCTIVPKNPKTRCSLPFDNEIKELKLIIEVHGQQHYKKCKWSPTKESLQYRQLIDRYKRIIAKQKGYNYIEIPYWTDNKNEDWKQLIDNKINEILHK